MPADTVFISQHKVPAFLNLIATVEGLTGNMYFDAMHRLDFRRYMMRQ